MEKETITREELYNLVWSKPLTKIAEMYGLSDNGVRKICIKMNIPLPQRGHWAKVKYGYKVKALNLPKKYSGKNEVTFNTDGVEEFVSGVSPLKFLMREIENTPNLPLKVPDKLSKPVKLIIEARNALKNEKPGSYKPSRENGIVSTFRNQLNISVAKKNVGRALRIMDTIIKLFRLRGHEVFIDDHKTFVKIYGQNVEMRLKEKMKRTTISTNYSWNDYEYHPSGILSFKLESDWRTRNREWNDGQELLEEKIPSILAKLEILGKILHKERLELEERWKIRDEEERIEKERLARVQKERDDVKAFLKDANRWQHAQFLRNYLQDLKKSATSNIKLTEELNNYIDWANHKIDWYDPLINANDKFLVDKDKDDLFTPAEKPKSPTNHPFW